MARTPTTNEQSDWMKYSKVIRHKDFAKRIEIACENHAHAPSGHGRQVWLKNALEEKFDEKVSTEAVRKWFAGEARPKPKMMSIVARALAVDEAWLALGITPTATPVEKRKQNALASGAVNLVAAQIQLAGGNIAFPEDPDAFDLSAIIRGKSLNITVRLLSAGTSVTHVPMARGVVLAVVPTDNPTVFDFFEIPHLVFDDSGTIRGDYVEIELHAMAGKVISANRALPQVKDFSRFEPFKEV